jgi:hypothetical protein
VHQEAVLSAKHVFHSVRSKQALAVLRVLYDQFGRKEKKR